MIKSLVQLLRQRRPQSLGALQALGIKLEFLDSGVFRKIYAVRGCDLIVKIPRTYKAGPGDPPWKDPLVHARKEIALIEKIESDNSLRHLRRYTPKIYYADPESGLVVMQRYTRTSRIRRFICKLEERVISRMFRETLGMFTADYGMQNLMRDEKGNAVLIDLGY